MEPVIIESPYSGDVQRNIRYARKAMKDALDRGEAPFASHLLYTQRGVLNDEIPEEREKGIQAGFEWAERASKRAVYTDFGITKGMEKGIEHAEKLGQTVVRRTLDNVGDLTSDREWNHEEPYSSVVFSEGSGTSIMSRLQEVCGTVAEFDEVGYAHGGLQWGPEGAVRRPVVKVSPRLEIDDVDNPDEHCQKIERKIWNTIGPSPMGVPVTCEFFPLDDGPCRFNSKVVIHPDS